MSAKQKDVDSSPAHDQKLFYAGFFRLGETFFPNFLNVSKGSPFLFFLFCKRMDVQKFTKAPLYIFRHYATYRRPKKIEKKIRKKIQKSGFFFNFFLTRVL